MHPRPPFEPRQDVRRHTVQPTFWPATGANLWRDQALQDHPQVSPYQMHPPQGPTADISYQIPPFSNNLDPPTGSATFFNPASSIPSCISLQPARPVPPSDQPQVEEPPPQPNRPRRKQQNSQHPHYEEAEWEKHRPKIKELYIEKNLSLKDTMKTMLDGFAFNPSEKMYKDKFKDWNISKNLPRKKALFMLNKHEQRKRQLPEGKDTIFVYGEQSWTIERVRKTVKKAKIAEEETAAIDVDTPYDITYRTPHNVPPSPYATRPPKECDGPAEKWTPVPTASKPELNFLKLTWNGHSLPDIEAIKRDAHKLDHEGDVENAERRYREALAGFENLLSPTHEDTKAVAYQLAAFYAGNDRMDDADKVLNWMSEKHMERWGMAHENTLRHFLRVAELFNEWNRTDDATTFLYRVFDAWDKGDYDDPDPLRVNGNRKESSETAIQQPETVDMTRAFAETDDPARVDYQLGLAEAQAIRNDESAEPLLVRLAEQCEKYPEKLSEQILQARSTLVKLFKRREDEEGIRIALGKARASLKTVLASALTKTERLLKAGIGVAALHVERTGLNIAEDMFQILGDKAEEWFGTDHESTIRLLINIGKVYQEKNMWSNAEPWFERALSASMTADGLESTMTKRLEKALESQRYTVEALTHQELESFVRSSGSTLRRVPPG